MSTFQQPSVSRGHRLSPPKTIYSINPLTFNLQSVFLGYKHIMLIPLKNDWDFCVIGWYPYNHSGNRLVFEPIPPLTIE